MAKRAFLLILLCLWIAASIWLARVAPSLQGMNYLGLSIYPQHSVAKMSLAAESPHESGVITFAETIVMDFETGKTRRMIDEPLALMMDMTDDGKAHWLVSRSAAGCVDPSNPEDMFWVVTEIESGNVVYDRPFPFRPNQGNVVVGNRYLVNKSSRNQFTVYDLSDQDLAPRGYDATGWGSPLRAIEKTDYFLMQPQRAGRSATYGLFRVNDNGAIELVGKIPASRNPRNPYSDFGLQPPFIASLSPSLDAIEIWSLESAEPLRKLELPKAIDPNLETWSFHETYFMIRRGTELQWIDWVSGKRFGPITTKDEHADLTGHFLTLYEDEHRRVIDIPTGKEIGHIRTSEWLRVVDGKTAFTSTHQYGWTVNHYDLASGKLIRQWKPFWYVIPVLLALWIGWVVWSTLWVKLSVKSGEPAWLDLLMIAIPVFGVLTYRAYANGSTLDASRPVYHYAQGVAMAGATLAMTWLVFGKTRWTLRILPLLSVCGLVTLALAVVFRQHQQTAWHALASAFFPVACLSLVFLPMRWMGWRLFQFETRDTTDRTTSTAFPIRDLFWITFLMSSLFAAFRFIASGFDGVIDVQVMIWPLVICLFVGTLCLLTAMSRRKGLFLVATVLVGVSMLYLSEYPVSRFAIGRWADGLTLLPSNHIQRVLMTFAVGVFALLLPYRVRGWRFGRATGYSTFSDNA